MNIKMCAAFLLLLVVPFLVPLNAQAERGLTVAVASNFVTTATEISGLFTEVHGIDVRISSGSTGLLYAQIRQGAPYDVFLAADQHRPQLLSDDGFGAKNGRFDYAQGYLVLWSRDPALRDEDCLEVLLSGDFRRLATANPAVAPYGYAAQQFLRANNAWDAVESKLVLGENVAQTFQFVSTGNASLGLLALSQVTGNEFADAPCRIPLRPPEAMAVVQGGLVLRQSANPEAAGLFADFLLSPQAVRVLRDSGYDSVRVPEAGIH